MLLQNDITLDQLSIESSASGFEQGKCTLNVSTLQLLQGYYGLDGGTLANATVSGPGTFLISADIGKVSTLSHVTLASHATVFYGVTEVDLNNGFSLAGGSISLIGEAGLTGPELNFAGTGGITGTGTIQLNGPRLHVYGAGTIGSGITVTSSNSSGTIDLPGAAMTNFGTIAGDASNLVISAGTFTNNGTVQASNGGSLQLTGYWSNAGTLVVNGGQLALGGTFSTAGLGQINRTGGTITLQGTLDNTGQALVLGNAIGPWESNGGVIRGGTFSTTGSGTLVGAMTFDGVTLASDFSTSSALTLTNSFTLAGATLSTSQGLSLGSDVQIGGSGSVLLNNSGMAQFIGLNGHTLTVGSGVSLATSQFGFYLNGSTTNHGTISASGGGTIYLGVGTETNDGTWEARNGGTLTIDGNWSSSGTISVNNGTVNLSGTFSSALSMGSTLVGTRQRLICLV